MDDRERAERLEAEVPDEALRRREFLQRTAYTAGLAGLAGTLPADTLVAEAAKRQRRTRLPSPRNLPIDTFVVLMMENRSFDHYLGWMPDADGRQAGITYTDQAGKEQETARLTPEYQGCGHPDPGHGWESGRVQFNRGKLDGWLKEGSGTDEFAIGYYGEGDLGFIQPATKGATTFDRFFCSILASTYPNREYMWAAQSYGNRENDLPVDSAGFPYETTLFAAVERAGGTVGAYFNDLPPAALWGVAGMQRASRVEDYYLACAAGSLPNVAFVDPPFKDGGGGDGISADEHPHGDVRLGQAYISDVVHAFMESPQWERGAIFVVYDEWGGFFDHVRPPRVPDMRNSRDLDEDFGQMGFRIPALVLSPYARQGHVDHGTYGFESIIKLIRHRFGIKKALTRRDAYARNIGYAFDFKGDPRVEPPDVPDPGNVVTATCSARGLGAPQPEPLPNPLPPLGRRGQKLAAPKRPKAHDLALLEETGYLDRLGIKYPKSDPASMFRQPSKVLGAYRDST
ncbi:MAG TPA: alkaline phosphatase family protein [Thermoleophilaceae bacterium]|nr:alkaline phosphatase family protein [Thermoleophilaceae bacterium]